MKMRGFIFAVIAWMPFGLDALAPQVEENAGSMVEESDWSELREGTLEIEGDSAANLNTGPHTRYSFLNMDANRIEFNGDDWADLRQRYMNTDTDVFTFVHVGDSHIQADIATGDIRMNLQSRHGNAGRGLVTPFRIAGTNEPQDYRFTLDCRSTTAKIIKQPWTVPVGFTGIGVAPARSTFNIYIENRKYFDNPFRFIRIYASGKYSITTIKTEAGTEVDFTTDRDDEEGYTDVFLSRPLSAATLAFSAEKGATIHGMMLSAEEAGVIYHAIGNNGATFTAYNSISGFGRALSTLYPDLIIVSLGTNEAFGKISSELFYAEIHRLVTDIRLHNPEAKVLLTTPKECQRRIGRKRQKRGTYAVVDNCRRLRDVILDYAQANSVAVYDWYSVAGGDGAAAHWVSNSLLSRDRIHNTWEGYRLFGSLFGEALEQALAQGTDAWMSAPDNGSGTNEPHISR